MRAQVWDHLHTLSTKYPVEGNKDGTYLTFFSIGGFIFGIINIIGNFGAPTVNQRTCGQPPPLIPGRALTGRAARGAGTVFNDQAYWQSAIAAKPSAAHMGYLLGGLMWFCIPFTLATTLGISALALDLPISIAESNAGAASPGKVSLRVWRMC